MDTWKAINVFVGGADLHHLASAELQSALFA